MKKYSIYIIAFLWVTLLTGCSDFLEKEYDLTTSEESIFSNATLTRDFLTNLYFFLPDGVGIYADNQFTGASRDCMTDNSVSYWDLHYYGKIAMDSYTALDHPLNYFWGNNFKAIRRANKFLANISNGVISNATVSGDDNKLYERYRAEAIFLRALYHFELVAYFGDIPILYDREAGAGVNPVTDQDFGIILDMENPETLALYRDPAAEVLEWVAQQCDYIKDVLPFRYASEGNWGRVNGASAYALKSRALLYRASALNNPSNDRTHWANAAQAAQDFITKNNSSGRAFGLYKNTTSSSATGTDHYGECFYATPYNNNEIILSRSIWHTNAVETNLLPPGFSGGGGRTNPTQNFVDAYEMANGKFIDESGSGYDPQKPYDNRDPRLKATVFAHGDVWGRADYNEQRTIDVSDGGPDYRGDMGGTFTGYYLKKGVNPSYVIYENTTHDHAWVLYRYGEILLNYAEALNEANNGPTQAAYDAINEVRERAGMPAVSGLTYESFRKRVRNERRVELCFEDHRYFDLRRWKSYEDQNITSELSLPRYEQLYNIYSMTVSGTGNSAVFTGTTVGENYKDSNVPTPVFRAPKSYYFPIPDADIKKSTTLEQNTGW